MQEALIANEEAAHEATGKPLLERQSDGRIAARVGDEQRVVHVRRCFPWSEPGLFVSLGDDEGDEFVLIEDPRSLDASSRQVLEEALAEAGFLFDVTGVTEIEEEVELRHWRVHTSQGNRSFQTRLDDWPRKLPDGRLLIRDIVGDLYRIGDMETLDAKSRSLLWAFVD